MTRTANADLLDSLRDQLAERSQGNPGAINVMCMGVLHHGARFWTALEGTTLRGPAIWTAYKDDCGGRLDLLLEEMEAGVGA